MPLLENDTLFAFLDRSDKKHGTASRMFSKLEKGELRVDASSVSLVEMELVYMSEQKEERLLGDLAAVAALPNVNYLAFTPDLAVASAYIRSQQGLGFFDSHYAAAALQRDGKIISFDRAYDKVPGLTRIDPADAAAGTGAKKSKRKSGATDPVEMALNGKKFASIRAEEIEETSMAEQGRYE